MNRLKNIYAFLPFSIVTVLGLQSMRVLLPLFQQYLRDSVGISSLNLAPIALVVFGLAFLPGVAVRRLGMARVLSFSVTAIPMLRLLEQLSRISWIDLLLSGAAAVLFWWFLALAYSVLAASKQNKNLFSTGLLFGLALDTAIHAAAGTLDLSWQSGFLPLGVVLLLAGWLLTSGTAWVQRVTADLKETTGLQVPGRLAALGIWLLLQMMVFQNVARFAAISGFDLPLSGIIVTAGNVVAIMVALMRPAAGKHTAWVSGLLLAVLLGISELEGTAGIVWLLAGQAWLAAWLAATAVPAPGETGSNRLLGHTFGPASLLYVVGAFLYYVSYDLSVGLSGPAFLPYFAVFLTLSGLAVIRDAPPAGAQSLQPVAAAVLLLVLPVGYWLSWETPETVAPPANGKQVRVMSYNLHQAFDTQGQLSIEEIAVQIEESGADVVGLQEVARGYLTTGSFDMLGWLSHRLGMPYISGPASDAQWGNAILSRYPISSAEVQPLPPDSLLIKRGFIQATVVVGETEITIIATHLHNPRGDGYIREQQVPVLLDAWAGQPRTVILGDLNAVPESTEMNMIADAGFLNASAGTSPDAALTFPSTAPAREIDYIWYTPDLADSDFQIYQTEASDHLPLAVTLSLP